MSRPMINYFKLIRRLFQASTASSPRALQKIGVTSDRRRSGNVEYRPDGVGRVLHSPAGFGDSAVLNAQREREGLKREKYLCGRRKEKRRKRD